MAKSSPPTQAQSLRRHLEETSRDLAAAQAGFDQTADRDLLEYYLYEISALRAAHLSAAADEILGNGGHIMNLFAEGGPWLTILFFSVLFLVIFRRPLGWLLKLLARSALGLGFLALWSQSGLAAGLALGVNAFNALTLGLLGLPGLGLLFLFRWVGT